jgi:hypothetical protein
VKKSLAKPGSPAELVSELMRHDVKGQSLDIRRDRSTEKDDDATKNDMTQTMDKGANFLFDMGFDI